MQKDNREQIGDGTVERGDDVAYAEVQSALRRHVRVSKGLPEEPVQLDVRAMSQLPSAPIIENVEPEGTTKILDISSLPPTHSVVGLSVFQKRLEAKKLRRVA